MPALFKVNKAEAESFAKVWNQGGVTMLLNDTAINFATDFSNVVLRNFIDMCQQEVVAKKTQQTKQLIVEG